MSTLTGKERAPQILVAEDNEANRTLIVDALELFGFEPPTVNNGKAALEALRERHFDVVFMDCRMPEMGGLEATRILRQCEGRENRSRVPVIALTAYAMAGDKERCLQAGMDDYLAKPFELIQLKNVVERFVERDR